MVSKKSYASFIQIARDKKLEIHLVDDRIDSYHLMLKDGLVYYETFVLKNNGPEQLDFEEYQKQSALDSFSEGSLSVSIKDNTSLFSKPYDTLIVLSKDDEGDPLSIKSRKNGKDVQLMTITYDEDGDLQSITVGDF